jgi:hypothetical protein
VGEVGWVGVEVGVGVDIGVVMVLAAMLWTREGPSGDPRPVAVLAVAPAAVPPPGLLNPLQVTDPPHENCCQGETPPRPQGGVVGELDTEWKPVEARA